MLRSWRPSLNAPTRRTSRPRASSDRRLSADDPVARDQPADVDRHGQPGARARSAGLPVAADQRQGRARGDRSSHHRYHRRDPADGQGAERRRPHHRRGPAAGEVGRRSRRTGTSLRATVSPAPETTDTLARNRRLRPPAPGAGRPRAVARHRPVPGPPRPRRSLDDPLRIAYLLSSLLDIKPEDKQKMLEARQRCHQARQPSRHALGREIDAARDEEARSNRARATGDDRRAAAILPAPAAQGDPGRARRRRQARSGELQEAVWPMPSCPSRSQTVADREIESPRADDRRPRPNIR